MSSPLTFNLGDDPLSWESYCDVVYGGGAVGWETSGKAAESREALEQLVSTGAVVYSVNTGVGADAMRAISADAINEAQLNLLRAHAVGVGEPVGDEVARGMLLLKAQTFSRGFSGVRPELVDAILELLNAGAVPVIPSLGTTSAADLIPNGHLGLAVIGEGDVLVDGERRPAHTVTRGLTPTMKEASSLLDDCAYSTAIGVQLVRDLERLLDRTDLVASLTLQVLHGHAAAFSDRVVGLRPHPGAIATAAHLRELLAGQSMLGKAPRPHDPFCLRCLPQVHGAVRDAAAAARSAITVELASIGDNPVVFADEGLVMSGGNFHGAPLGLPIEALCPAILQLASLSRQRVRHLLTGAIETELPAKLAADPSTQTGLAMLDTVAGSLLVEAAGLAAPVSVFAVQSDPMEDHAPMTAIAARRAQTILELARRVVAVELACAAQALDFRRPEQAAAPAEELFTAVRERMPFVDSDRSISIDVLCDLL